MEELRIKDFTPRLYQETILASAAKNNTLVVLPTGLGKTNIFVLLAIQRLKMYPKSKVLMLGPTRPLIDQYKAVFERHTNMPDDQMSVFTGMVRPATRHKLWKSSRIIFSTPQGLENDIISGNISLKDVSLICFDEAHRAVGDYAYVWIAKQYDKTGDFSRILGLTASPGDNMDTITEVCSNLFIEDVEARADTDSDVKPYIKDIDIKWIPVELTEEMKKIKNALQAVFDKAVKRLRDWDAIDGKKRFISRTDLIKLQGHLQARISQGDTDTNIWSCISTVAQAMKVQHAIELIESQGIHPLVQYINKLENDARTTKVKAVKTLIVDSDFRTAAALTRIAEEKGFEHPKLIKLSELIKARIVPGYKLIIFTQYRDTGVQIVDKLNKSKVSSRLFVGQMKKGETGLSQKEQKATIADFRDGKFQVLVSTSVGEEGLDIPAVDMVVFYEPVPSAIRTVQRRGRTGRQTKGEVQVLYSRGTRDETYRWAAHHKEKRMVSHLQSLKSVLAKVSRKKEDLTEFIENIVLTADFREKGSGTIKRLIELGVDVKLDQLPVADFVISDRVAIEMKTVEDFVNSILDGRLLVQLQDLKKSYPRPLVIVEGTQNIFSVRNVHPNAIRGMLATISVSYGIPILQTKDSRESASMIAVIAKREFQQGRTYTPHAEKRTMDDTHMQEYIVSALPGIGSSLAIPLLKKFKTVQNVMNAEEKELETVDKIGTKKAKKIRELLQKEY